jgi:hypothetical protein
MISTRDRVKIHKCPDCRCKPKTDQCARFVPARTYSPAGRCQKDAAVGSPFCRVHGKK